MTTKDFIQQIRERIARDELAEAFRLPIRWSDCYACIFSVALKSAPLPR